MAATFKWLFEIGGKANSSLKGAQSDLLKNISVMEKYQGQLKNVRTLSQQFAAAQQNVAKAVKAAKADPENKKLQEGFQKAIQTAQKLHDALGKSREEAQKSKSALAGAGVAAGQLASSYSKMTKQAEAAAQKQARLNALEAKLAGNDKAKGIMRQGLGVAVGAAASIVVPIRVSMDFEQAMAGVKAISGATGEEAARLEEQARKLGEATSFKASEAAEGQKMLALAGFKVNEILATMPGLLSVAKAADMDLANASTIVADSLRGFNLPAEQTGRVADVLTQGFTTSNQTLSDLGEAMKYVAPIATEAGQSIEATTAMIGLMSNAGIKGSMAGTALRQALMQVSNPQVSAGLSKIGVATKDAAGNLRPMTAILGDMGKAMSARNMGSADRIALLSAVFDKRAAAGMAKLLDQMKGGELVAYIDKITNSQGRAADVAEVMGDSTKGSLVRMMSAWESLNITIGKIFSPIRAVFDALGAVFGWVSRLVTEFPILGGILGGVGGTLTILTVTLFGLGYAFLMTRGALTGLQIAMETFHVKAKLVAIGTKLMTAAQWLWNAAMYANPVVWVIAAIIAAVALLAGAAYLIYRHWDTISAFYVNLWNGVKNAFLSAWEWLKGFMSGWGGWIVAAMAGPFGLIGMLIYRNFDKIKAFFTEAVAWFKDSGLALIHAIGEGILSGAGWLYDKLKSALGPVGKLLAHSDAEEGPLSQLTASGRAIPTTIGEGVAQAGSSPVTTPLKGALQPVVNPLGGGAGGSPISISFSPSITIQGGGPDVESQIQNALHLGLDDLRRMIEDLMSRERRLSLA
jgi:TP901 family phage tail tape measure protein